MTRIVVRPPRRDEKGFLRRQRELIGYQEALRDNPTIAKFDEFIEWMLPRIIEPADQDEAREALLDASQEELESIGQITAGVDASNPT